MFTVLRRYSHQKYDSRAANTVASITSMESPPCQWLLRPRSMFSCGYYLITARTWRNVCGWRPAARWSYKYSPLSVGCRKWSHDLPVVDRDIISCSGNTRGRRYTNSTFDFCTDQLKYQVWLVSILGTRHRNDIIERMHSFASVI